MVERRIINRIYRAHDGDAQTIERAQQTSARSRRVLKDNPRPDTFIGRKTQEPFPQEESKYGETQDRGRPTRYPSQAGESQVTPVECQTKADQLGGEKVRKSPRSAKKARE